jgi:hypothetical protein
MEIHFLENLNLIRPVRRHFKEWVNQHHFKLETLTDENDMIKKCMIKDFARGLNYIKR